MSSCLIDSSDQKADSEGSLIWMACLSLGLLADDGDETLARVLRSIDVLVVEASISHEFGEESGICSHARNDDAHMGVDLEDLLLVNGQVMGALLQSN